MRNPTYEAMTNAATETTARKAFGLVNAVQLSEMSKGEALLSVTCLFSLLCLRFGVKPQDALLLAGNMIATDRPEFRAMQRYLNEEVE